ncbi:MAG TPA: LuxR C-terminal-related transcriptional regulator [Leptolyngbyaceae cyanobacterium]
MNANSLAVATQEIPTLTAWKNSRFSIQEVSQPKHDRSEFRTVGSALFDSPWIALAEALREGVMVISRHTKPMYVNQQAKEICQKLGDSNRYFGNLPLAISEVCHRLIKNGNSINSPLIVECQTNQGETIRMRASWLNLPCNDDSNQYIIVFLENRDRILQEELQFEQQKYQLTDREMEIWSLLRQDYSYQEIAGTLHISLNTVKTHVKNIYAKKRWNQEKDCQEAC